MTSKVHAWDECWRAVEEAGIHRSYDDPRGDYLPIGESGVSYGKMVVDRVESLRATRLTIQQILVIADLIRAVAKASIISHG